ncbi:MAG: hypothetical protein JWN11_1610 [Hyphomicrobiales bacterium]|nr:hypothetical protein [Hyphomicrobiales bacterium]
MDVAQPKVTPNVVPAAGKPVAPTVAPVVLAAANVPAPAVQPEAVAATTAPGLIAATFERLQVASSPPKPDSTMAKRPATPVAGPASPTTRRVTTTAIRPDVAATPAGADANPADVTAKPIEVASTEPVQIPQAAPLAPKTVAEPAPAPAPAEKMQLAARDPAPPARPAQPAAKSGTMVVGGPGGVTVRSGPSKSNAGLFGLAVGQKVSVTSNQNGWLQIVDGQGRTGWAYSSFFANP